MSRLALLLACLLALAAPARAERLVSQVSNETIEITSSFSGERMSFFGTIIPDAGSTQKYVETEVTYEDGRKGRIRATVGIVDAKVYGTAQAQPAREAAE